MNSDIIKRVLEEADYIIKTEKTVRELALIFNVSKSTVHKDLHERLLEIDKDRYEEVDNILKYHIDVRHIRGGESTKNKYLIKKLERWNSVRKRYWNRFRNSKRINIC